jgi:hypothetical protein
MGETYANSYCNIAATGFPDGRRRIAVPRDPRNLQPRKIQIAKQAIRERELQPGSYYCMEDLWEDRIVNAQLNRCAWVFQERYLSPHALHFEAR